MDVDRTVLLERIIDRVEYGFHGCGARCATVPDREAETSDLASPFVGKLREGGLVGYERLTVRAPLVFFLKTDHGADSGVEERSELLTGLRRVGASRITAGKQSVLYHPPRLGEGTVRQGLTSTIATKACMVPARLHACDDSLERGECQSELDLQTGAARIEHTLQTRRGDKACEERWTDVTS
jgi:hypothetical protein